MENTKSVIVEMSDNNYHNDDGNNFFAYGRFIRMLRPLAYTNEFGESFRHIFPKLIAPAYIISFGYIGLDIANKVINTKPERRITTAFDNILWHGIASIAVPSFTIHSIVKITRKFSTKRIMPPVLGLAAIPFIVIPIDHGTDYLMDNYIRPYYSKYF